MPRLDRLDPASLAPFPAGPSFEGLVADRLGQLAGADAVFGRIATTASAHPLTDLDPIFDGTVRAGADALANETATLPPSPLPDFIDAGDNADTLRQGVVQYLPPPDASIEQTFDPPPDAPPFDQLPPEPREPPPVK